MQSVVLFVFLLLYIGSVFSCYPCECGYFDWGGHWTNMKIGNCKRDSISTTITSIPNTIDADIDGLNMYKQSITSLHENQFIHFTKLQIILSRYNQISYIHKDALRNMKHLKLISLGENSIIELPRELFTHTPNISKIYVNKNKLTILQTKLFSNLTLLKEIHLDNNAISIIEENCFINLPSLEILYLSNNLLKSLQLNLQNDFPKLKSLFLFNNTWNCDDYLCEVINAVLTRGLKDNRPIPTCTTPRNIRGKQWSALKLEDFTPTIVSNLTNVEEEDNITLQCKYCFVSSIIWKLNNTEILRESQDENSIISTITLENVRKEDTGKYSCHVENCEKCKDTSTFVSVTEKFTTTVEADIFTDETSTYTSRFKFYSASTTTCAGSISLLLISLLILI